MTGRDHAAVFAKSMQCNCDLDNWEPERSTGHSCVCRIHRAAMAATLASARSETRGELTGADAAARAAAADTSVGEAA